jgi:hypothetical protein
MPVPSPQSPTNVVVAFWRDNNGQTEFWVPTYGNYLEIMALPVTRDLAAGARNWLHNHFNLHPRCNVRLFATGLSYVAAFALTSAEAAQIEERGMWLSAHLIHSKAGRMLQDIAERL